MKNITCPKCHNNINSAVAFCPVCGVEISKIKNEAYNKNKAKMSDSVAHTFGNKRIRTILFLVIIIAIIVLVGFSIFNTSFLNNKASDSKNSVSAVMSNSANTDKYESLGNTAGNSSSGGKYISKDGFDCVCGINGIYKQNNSKFDCIVTGSYKSLCASNDKLFFTNKEGTKNFIIYNYKDTDEYDPVEFLQSCDSFKTANICVKDNTITVVKCNSQSVKTLTSNLDSDLNNPNNYTVSDVSTNAKTCWSSYLPDKFVLLCSDGKSYEVFSDNKNLINGVGTVKDIAIMDNNVVILVGSGSSNKLIIHNYNGNYKETVLNDEADKIISSGNTLLLHYKKGYFTWCSVETIMTHLIDDLSISSEKIVGLFDQGSNFGITDKNNQIYIYNPNEDSVDTTQI